MKSLTILGIETSCDETAAAVLRLDGNGPRVLSDIVLGQAAAHAPYKGVVPEIAARAHVEGLDGTIAAAMRDAGVAFSEQFENYLPFLLAHFELKKVNSHRPKVTRSRNLQSNLVQTFRDRFH